MMSLWHMEMVRNVVSNWNTWSAPQQNELHMKARNHLVNGRFISANDYDASTFFIEAHIISSSTQIIWKLNIKPPHGGALTIASLKLSQTEANCSSLLLSEAYNIGVKGATTELLKVALTWAQKARYSFVHCSMNDSQFPYYDKVLKPIFRFKKMGTKYRNPRSGHRIMWAYKIFNQGMAKGYF